MYSLQVQHLKRQLKDKNTLADYTLNRNKFMEIQRRNALVDELHLFNNELGRGSLPYHDKTVLKSKRDELIKELNTSVL